MRYLPRCDGPPMREPMRLTQSRQSDPPDSLDGAGLLFGLGRCRCQLNKQCKCLAIQLVGRRKKVKDHP
jgi:hypothetical protein